MLILLIVIILIVIFLFNSFSKFNSFMRKNESNLKQINSEIRLNPENTALTYRKAICLMNLHNYPLAVHEFENVINQHKIHNISDRSILLSSEKNIEFCRRPFPWSSSFVVDKSGSYLHYLLLKYAGNKRSILI